MRIVSNCKSKEEDTSQNFWVFGPSFVQPSQQSNPRVKKEEEELPPPPPPPPAATAAEAPADTRGKKRVRDDFKKKKKKNGWTKERYEQAEMKVIDLVREKAGGRIARKELRENARKHIGDTGLLDHLLKHMYGKVVGDGSERFMRGYNVDGVMYYWLEPVGVEENGNCSCQCGDGCREEIRQLKEKIESLNRNLEELLSSKEVEKSTLKENYEKLLEKNTKLEADMSEMNISFQKLKETYDRLPKKNMKLEAEMSGVNGSLQGCKEEMLRGEKKEDKGEKKAAEIETIKDAKGVTENGGGVMKNGNKQLHKC